MQRLGVDVASAGEADGAEKSAQKERQAAIQALKEQLEQKREAKLAAVAKEQEELLAAEEQRSAEEARRAEESVEAEVQQMSTCCPVPRDKILVAVVAPSLVPPGVHNLVDVHATPVNPNHRAGNASGQQTFTSDFDFSFRRLPFPPLLVRPTRAPQRCAQGPERVSCPQRKEPDDGIAVVARAAVDPPIAKPTRSGTPTPHPPPNRPRAAPCQRRPRPPQPQPRESHPRRCCPHWPPRPRRCLRLPRCGRAPSPCPARRPRCRGSCGAARPRHCARSWPRRPSAATWWRCSPRRPRAAPSR